MPRLSRSGIVFYVAHVHFLYLGVLVVVMEENVVSFSYVLHRLHVVNDHKSSLDLS